MRPALLVLPLVFVTACATPREACINGVNSELRVINTLIADTRTNLVRGYAVETRQEVRTVTEQCTGRDSNGNPFTFRCEQTETIETEVPVAIDLNAERAKLTSLEERQFQMQQNAQSGIAQCIATHPE